MRYDPLQNFLAATPAHIQTTVLSFAQIEQLIQTSLPNSAHQYREWWANQTDVSDRPQARAWMLAGYLVQEVNLAAKWVHFHKEVL